MAPVSRPRSQSYPLARRPDSHSHVGQPPAERMPRDIWEEIFVRTLPQCPDAQSVFSCRSSEVASYLSAPLVLLRVCRSWRTTALTLPHLWTRLFLVVNDGRISPPLPVARRWLRRSGALPLTLSLWQTSEAHGNQEVTDDALGLFLSYIDRWMDIRLDIANPTYGRSLRPSADLQAPLLESFNLTTCMRFSPNEEMMQDLLRMLEAAPRLLSFSVSRLSDLEVTPSTTLAIPWSQLIRLDLGFIPSVKTCLDIMRGCPNLQRCNLNIDPHEGAFPPSSIVLTSLTSLELHISADEMATFLDRADFPALRDIALYQHDSFDRPAPWPQKSFIDFLTRSKCTLASLELHDTSLSANEFIDCAQHRSIRLLSTLVIHDSRDWTWPPVITSRVLELLTAGPGEPLLPALENLDLGRGCWTGMNDMLSDMLESRWHISAKGNIARLKHVNIDLYLLDATAVDKSRLQHLRNEGMKVRLHYYHD